MTPAIATPTEHAPSTASQSASGYTDLARLWEIHRVHAPLVSSAVHAGHLMRSEVAAGHRLPEDERLREEDPFTDRLLPASGSRVVVHRSRFECDLNRPRDEAVYRTPDDAWGLDLWHQGAPSEALVERSLARYDAFYRDLEHHLEEVTREWGRVVFYDLHSYNHRRGGPGAALDDAETNPVINLGTGNLERRRWAPVVETFLAEMARQEVGGAPLDVRENVRFRGGHLSAWICQRFPRSVCPLAIEVKKGFMDEWSGEPDDDAIAEVGAALAATVPAVTAALHRVGARPGEEG